LISPLATARTRTARRLAIGIVAVCLAMLGFIVVSLVAPRGSMPNHPTWLGVVCFMSVFVAFPLVGGLIAIRRPGHPIGWLFLAIAVGMTMTIFSTEYVNRAIFLGWPLPAIELVAWAGSWMLLPAIGIAFTLVPLLFPDGRFLGRGWRLVGGLATVVLIVGAIAWALPAGPIRGTGDRILNPIALPAELTDLVHTVSDLAFVLLALLGAASIASLGLRFRRGDPVERAQIKWFAFAALAFLVALSGAFAIGNEEAMTAAFGCLACIPIATGIAILRYRLFDIDRIVSRTIGWLAVTAVLASVFAGGVVLAQAVLEPVTGGSTIGVAASTLVAAALFSPVRSRVQRAVDRRFNRARYDAERTAAAFAERLRDEVDLETLRADLGAVAIRTLEPASVAVWVREGRVS
jgi:hypothetical protein